jgi:hypothetical protein
VRVVHWVLAEMVTHKVQMEPLVKVIAGTHHWLVAVAVGVLVALPA